ncbi:MAG: cytochrome c3 family protein [Desulfovibrionales bacterium]
MHSFRFLVLSVFALIFLFGCGNEPDEQDMDTSGQTVIEEEATDRKNASSGSSGSLSQDPQDKEQTTDAASGSARNQTEEVLPSGAGDQEEVEQPVREQPVQEELTETQQEAESEQNLDREEKVLEEPQKAQPETEEMKEPEAQETQSPEPPSDLVLRAPEGVDAKQGPVDFSHIAHEQLECGACHHTWDGEGPIQGCMSQGCHDLIDPKSPQEKRDPAYYYTAFHARGSELSCVGCHTSMKRRGESFGPTGCQDCHSNEG